MISAVEREIGGRRYVFRLSARAMMALEARFDRGLMELMQGLQSGFRVTDLCAILAEAAEDGAGMPVDDAARIVDVMGVGAAGKLLGEVSEAAFPEATEKKAKPAGRKK